MLERIFKLKQNNTNPRTEIIAFLTIILIPLTFSISRGIGYGFIAYTLVKLLRGKVREVHPLMALVSILFALSFALQR